MSWEREYLRKDHDLVLKLFDYRCIVCGKKTNEVHEIIPISNGKKYLAIKNRVPMCREDHNIAHKSTKKSIPLLQEARRGFIIRVMWNLALKKYPKFMRSQL
jgi:5-methylcytosine-specific restriction endonuclease McrA